MNSRTAFHIDCTAVIPECAYQCAKCIEEMESILTDVQGVRKFYTKDDGVVVEHDPSVVTVEQLIDVFEGLPSFYEGNFVPTVITS